MHRLKSLDWAPVMLLMRRVSLVWSGYFRILGRGEISRIRRPEIRPSEFNDSVHCTRIFCCLTHKQDLGPIEWLFLTERSLTAPSNTAETCGHLVNGRSTHPHETALIKLFPTQVANYPGIKCTVYLLCIYSRAKYARDNSPHLAPAPIPPQPPPRVKPIHIHFTPPSINITQKLGLSPFHPHMEVSWKRRTPQSSIWVAFSTINHPLGGIPIYGTPPLFTHS